MIVDQLGIEMRRIYYAQAVYGDKEIEAIMKVLSNPLSLSGGSFTKEFERKVSGLFSKKHGIMVNSGSSANLIAFELVDLPRGSEVITPILTFSTTVAPIVQKGLTPVFVDVEPGSYVVNIEQVEAAITSKTRALMIPLLLGNVPDIRRLWKVAHDNNLFLIEDSCDTLGATVAGYPTGMFSHISTTSFYGSHIITGCGGGGMVCVNDDEWDSRARMLRGWGRSSAVREEQTLEERFSTEIDGMPYDSKFLFEEIGYNFIPLEVSAAFGLAQLDRLEDFVRRRRKDFRALLEFFAKYEEFFVLPKQSEIVKTAWLAFPLTIKTEAPFTRLQIVRYLEENGIQTRPIFSGNILKHKGFRNIPCRKFSEDYPVANEIMRRSFLIGCHQGLSEDDLDYVKGVFSKFLDLML